MRGARNDVMTVTRRGSRYHARGQATGEHSVAARHSDDLSGAAADAARRAAATVASDTLRERCTETADRLVSPLRLAVGGRLKAGKSTLVNALVGRRVAATAAGECTKVVAWYRYGERDSVRVVGRDGSSWTVVPAADGSLPTDLGARAEEIDRVEVMVTARARLGRLTIVDTPGLFSLNDEYSAGTRRALGVLDDGSRGAVARADALAYLMPHPADTDRAFLEAFHAVYPESTLSAANVVGVLSRIDLLCRRPGLEDPWPGVHRRRRARRATPATFGPHRDPRRRAARRDRARQLVHRT